MAGEEHHTLHPGKAPPTETTDARLEEAQKKLASTLEERDNLAGEIASLRADHETLLNDCQVGKVAKERGGGGILFTVFCDGH